ncbi:MAG: galactosyltransferase-related protein [Leptolyngbya sp.]|nr:galactosyltransferase-related protein [Leptolyngbya sp.]
MATLSLITIYRRRPQHLAVQLAWWQRWRVQAAPSPPGCPQAWEWIVVEADARPTPGLKEHLEHHQARYLFLPNGGTLHKTKALNLGLSQAQGTYLTPLDVDLIPLPHTLEDHLHLATLSPQILVTGYRLMAPTSAVDLDHLDQAIADSTIAPEDQPSALRKHLLQGETFGVLPYFQRQRLLHIHGWDETYIGWGAEDQDLIERYLADGRYLLRSPQLVYLHLHHGADPDWREPEVIAANRRYYYSRPWHHPT